ncbi:hypothetical protein [Synechococcus sp. UW140]|uniref:hypothetical protein n=1 Tax=Synechococcus sp. UW140 TaxID=368503 RepID=UPI000E0EB8CF|nr:hypothetical protein [Synechococcus sp. UW140]
MPAEKPLQQRGRSDEHRDPTLPCLAPLASTALAKQLWAVEQVTSGQIRKNGGFEAHPSTSPRPADGAST